ncbi:diguanylate cyclase domain-containing protein [Erysipelatoclostridium sp. AM42-17]|uniref:diguanylate cyclase domain-containing protein n=1 Tax=Erysipelatoclostridium sp. AM42-17 TaxID=2293102 RepID=UPI000E50C460|nr:diguanylate cyclase [Erysipelatoclostridium sp. AM42-17]RHS93790.1 diguanylate cyclase [Erysipelatoclostridium sp. AM42-17]
MDEKIKSTILIVDDSQLNRLVLYELLNDRYNVIEATNGVDALNIIKEQDARIDLVLLDIIMPGVDGYEVLEEMNRLHFIDYIPVIMISSEGASSTVERAYELGATDYITRPFEKYIIMRRISNTIRLYQKQKKLLNLVEDQVQQRVDNNSMLIKVLANIVEFRNGESGLHVQHIQSLTKMLLMYLIQKTDQYQIDEYHVLLISTASALHDIGKISIDDKILNKPGRLTAEEFEIIKGHSLIGANMIQQIPSYKNDAMLRYAYDICRWHHERYDGRGYPDGLTGEEIPIWAQVVALADVYDALTSERCYKKAYSHKQAMEMILNGQCGTFNPLLLDCLCDIEEVIQRELENDYVRVDGQVVSKITDEIVENQLTKDISQIESKSHLPIEQQLGITFKYDLADDTVYISSRGAASLGLDQVIVHPANDDQSFLTKSNIKKLVSKLRQTDSLHTTVEMKFQLEFNHTKNWYKIHADSLWENQQYAGVIGNITCLNESEIVELNQNQHILKCSFTEALDIIEQLKKIFDHVRLVDIHNQKVVKITSQGIEESTEKCNEFWNHDHACRSCVSCHSYDKKGQAVKLEFIDHDVYGVIAEYIEIDNQPWVLEIICKTKEEILLSAHGHTKFMEKISQYNRQFYTDILTGCYSRRYYEEVVKHIDTIDAIAMIDGDNFKHINDHYGHAVGDLALQHMASAIKSCIRDDDLLIRYGGDEFILVFQNMVQETFKERLNIILNTVKNETINDYPDIHLSVTIGGVHGVHHVSDALKQADDLMYQGKDKTNHVIIKNENS